MNAGYDPVTPALVVEGPSTPAPAVPDRLRVGLGPLRFSGMVVGPDHPYVLDCWAAVVGPTPVLCLARLHQIVGLEVDARAVAASVGLVGGDWLARLGWCIQKLSRSRLLSYADQLVELSPALRILTDSELSAAGDLVRDLHSAHVAKSCAPGNRMDGPTLTGDRRTPGT